jgi:hypothetical protein
MSPKLTARNVFYLSLQGGRGLSSLILCLGISACSVYKSQGRNQFESAVPGKLQTQSIHDSTMEDLNETQSECWIQPAGEPLWHLSSEKKLSVRSISQSTLEACEVTP